MQSGIRGRLSDPDYTMCGQVESLNAAMAAGILMYEAARQAQRLKGGIFMAPVIWLILVAVLLVIEAATTALSSIWFAGGALAAAVAAWFTPGL